jgi:hypothetical protein
MKSPNFPTGTIVSLRFTSVKDANTAGTLSTAFIEHSSRKRFFAAEPLATNRDTNRLQRSFFAGFDPDVWKVPERTKENWK